MARKMGLVSVSNNSTILCRTDRLPRHIHIAISVDAIEGDMLGLEMCPDFEFASATCDLLDVGSNDSLNLEHDSPWQKELRDKLIENSTTIAVQRNIPRM